jgi:hypothetical protein
MVELLFVGGTADSGSISIVAAMKRASTSTASFLQIRCDPIESFFQYLGKPATS